MNTKHTPAPWNWTTGDNEVYVRQGGLIIAKMRKDYTPKENASRIVECVNALAGIDSPLEWVDKMKMLEEKPKEWFDGIAPEIIRLQSEIEKLKAENLRLIEQQLDVAWEVDADAAGLTKQEQADIRIMADRTIAASNAHDAEFKRLKAENEALKAEGLDAAFRHGMNWRHNQENAMKNGKQSI